MCIGWPHPLCPPINIYVTANAVTNDPDSLSGHTRSFGYLSQSTAAVPAAAGPSTRLLSSTGRRVPFSIIISPCITKFVCANAPSDSRHHKPSAQGTLRDRNARRSTARCMLDAVHEWWSHHWRVAEDEVAVLVKVRPQCAAAADVCHCSGVQLRLCRGAQLRGVQHRAAPVKQVQAAVWCHRNGFCTGI
jgi:hypothetical protein